MSPNKSLLHHNVLTHASRRDFLKSTAALAMAGPTISCNQQGNVRRTEGPQRARPVDKPRLLYVAPDRSAKGPEGSEGQGIYLFEMDSATGVLTRRAFFPHRGNPSWLVLNPFKTHLYSCDAGQGRHGKAAGAVTAYSIDQASGQLTQLNTVSTEGAGPAYISVHPSGRYVFAANYTGGSLAVLPILSNGELGAATDVHQDKGPLGPKHASSAPAGSFAISGHDAPHAHMIHADPSGNRVMSTDLGMDKILIWSFDLEKGKLTPNNPPWASAPPGGGPRHFVFHPNARWFYCIQEEGSTVVVFDYDEATGELTEKQVIPTLPKGFVGTNYTSEIRISPNAKFIYCANRLYDTIAFFSISETGTLTFVGEEWTRGDYPDSFTIDPSGDFLFSCNSHCDNVTTFRVNRETGHLSFTGQFTPIGAPADVVFLT